MHDRKTVEEVEVEKSKIREANAETDKKAFINIQSSIQEGAQIYLQ